MFCKNPLSDKLAQALGGEIHHGDNARIIKPRRADYPLRVACASRALSISRAISSVL